MRLGLKNEGFFFWLGLQIIQRWVMPPYLFSGLTLILNNNVSKVTLLLDLYEMQETFHGLS